MPSGEPARTWLSRKVAMSSQGADSSRMSRVWHPAALPPPALALLRSASAGLPKQIGRYVIDEVRLGEGVEAWNRRVQIGAEIAVAGFFDDAEAAVATRTFQEFGGAWANSRSGPLPVLDAIQAGMRPTWAAVHRLVEREGLHGTLPIMLADAITAYSRHLWSAVEQGFRDARIAMLDSRSQLLRVLLKGHQSDQSLEELGREIRWKLPERIVVLVADLGGATPPAELTRTPEVLWLIEGDRFAAVCDPARTSSTRAALVRVSPTVLVAEMWPVAPAEARDSYRWARKALALARAGELRPARGVVDCTQHRLRLWIETDNALSQTISLELLAPLLTLGAARRKALAETLLRWLQTRESAPVLAEQLGVHPNTIRLRLAHLHRMFGDQIDDPDQALALILALRTMRSRLE